MKLVVLAAVLASTLGDAGRALAQEQEEVSEDVEMLRQAEEHVREGRYSRAISLYKKLAKEFPTTMPGRMGHLRSQPTAYLGWKDLVRTGPSENRVDVVLMGDGFEGTDKDQRAFDSIAEQIPKWFERDDVFEEYLAYLNFVKVSLASKDDQYDEHGREYDTALDGKASRSLQGQVTVDADRVHEFLDLLPEHDGVAIAVVRKGVLGSARAGVASVGGRSQLTSMHEWGHAFAGLGDEYTTDTGHRGAPEGMPNVSATDDPERVPWKHWLEAKEPTVGIHSGANGRATGAWKPSHVCLMNDAEQFCVVCREAVVLAIYRHVDPIDGCAPEAHPPAWEDVAIEPLVAKEPLRFEVRAMQPTSHALHANWWILRAEDVATAAPASSTEEEEDLPADRRARGPLQPISREPTASSNSSKDGVHQLVFDPRDHEAGLYRVVCRVRDPVLTRGDKWPWVIHDPHGLLESERSWWVRVE